MSPNGEETPIVRLIRCPACRCPRTAVYSVKGRVQYRYCRRCEYRFKAIKEVDPDLTPAADRQTIPHTTPVSQDRRQCSKSPQPATPASSSASPARKPPSSTRKPTGEK